MPPHITRTWEVTLPIPHWILQFFHIKGGLIIRIKTSISAHRTEEEFNSFSIEVFFRKYISIPFPHQIEELRIVFGYLWPNQFYQEDPERADHTPSRVSLVTGVTTSEDSTQLNTPSPSLEPSIPNYINSEQQVPESSSTQSRPQNFNWSPFAGNLTVDQVFERI